MEYKVENKEMKSVKPDVGSSKRLTKLTKLQLD